METFLFVIKARHLVILLIYAKYKYSYLYIYVSTYTTA